MPHKIMTFITGNIIHALMITSFVVMMMLIIEYTNVFSKGSWHHSLRGSRWGQYLLGAFLGATPGCLGAFAMVSLYIHKEVSLGALVATMIATSGDEAFVMFAMIPKLSFLILIGLFLFGIFVGFLTDLFIPNSTGTCYSCTGEFHLHQGDECQCFNWETMRQQWRNYTPIRGILTSILFFFLVAVVGGWIGPHKWNWVKVTIIVLSTISFFIILSVPDHFLEEHLWEHVIKKHLPRIFLWTFGALVVMKLLTTQFHLDNWFKENQLIVLGIAVLVGMIPESGPHLIFLTLYVNGTIPLSIFIASSIVQDGHGMLPLLAESQKDFIKVKLINVLAGLAVGLIGFMSGW